MDWHEQSRPSKLSEAIGTGRQEVAWEAARRSIYVPLGDAARMLTMIRGRDLVYDKGVRRWMVRYIIENRPSPDDIHSAAFSLVRMRNSPKYLDQLVKMAGRYYS